VAVSRLWITVCRIVIGSQLPKKGRQEGVFRYLGLLAASPRHVLGVETAYHACFPQKKPAEDATKSGGLHP
jgi:hypothetical protein